MKTTSGAYGSVGNSRLPYKSWYDRSSKQNSLKAKKWALWVHPFFQSLWESLVQTLGSPVTKRLLKSHIDISRLVWEPTVSHIRFKSSSSLSLSADRRLRAPLALPGPGDGVLRAEARPRRPLPRLRGGPHHLHRHLPGRQGQGPDHQARANKQTSMRQQEIQLLHFDNLLLRDDWGSKVFTQASVEKCN